MSRVGTATAFAQSLSAMTEQQSRLVDIQNKLSTGRRFNAPSEDPVAAAQAELSRSQISRTEVEKRMVGFARSMLQQAEGAIGDGTELLQGVRELFLQAGNSTLSASDRSAIAEQIAGLRAELLGVANRRDASGGHIFGGQGSRTAPFVDNGVQVDYVATPGVQLVGRDMRFQTSVDGQAVFASGTGPAARSIFGVLDDAIALLRDPSASGDQIQVGLKSAIDGLDASLDRFNAGRAALGEQLRAVDSVERSLTAAGDEARQRLSEVADVDYAQAISDFANLQTSLTAAMRSYAQISQLSLFNYIR